MPTFKKSARFNISIDVLLILLFATRFCNLAPLAWLFSSASQRSPQ